MKTRIFGGFSGVSNKMLPTKSNTYDLNDILKVTDIVLVIIASALFAIKGANQYINHMSLILFYAFGGVSFMMLLYEKKHRSPLMVILVTTSLIFYMFRVLTLLNDPWSVVFSRSSFTCTHINHSFIFMNLANVCIFFGLISAKRSDNRDFSSFQENEYKSPKFFTIATILFFVLLIHYTGISQVHSIRRIASYITSFFIRLHIVMLLTMLYLVINHRKLKRQHLFLFFCLFTAYLLLNTLKGSRSSLLTFVFLLAIAWLAKYSCIRMSRKAILAATLIIPISILVFHFGTICRPHFGKSPLISSKSILSTINKLCHPNNFKTKLVYQRAFDRLGYFDYVTDMITNAEKYARVINFPYYARSIIDNCLTPGFDVYDIPRVSHSLKYIYTNSDKLPTHSDVNKAYQADMLTPYGEYYILFGKYLALCLFFVTGFAFGKTYASVRNRNKYLFYLYRCIIIFLFYKWLNSFGFDWFIFEGIGITITLSLFSFFYIHTLVRSEADAA